MWKRDDLHRLVREKMTDYLLVIVSNREPYVHTMRKGKVVFSRGTGGVITALDPVMRACSGTWVAAGTGDADRKVTDGAGRIGVPPDDPAYTLRRVWLSKEEENGYYYGYANEALWPLCHMTFTRPAFRREDWEQYVRVNEKFARAVIEEVGDRKAFVWVQDYHFCLLPRFLKQMAPDRLIVTHFWHIPWPGHEMFRICPQRKEILDGLLANDLLGFHIRLHCENFLDVVDREIECKIDRERTSIVRRGGETVVRPYPISVDFEGIAATADSDEVGSLARDLEEEFGIAGTRVVLGLDRIDYTKGIPERLLAVDRFLERHPEMREQFVFLQMGEISRIHIPRYKQLNEEINILVEQINWRHSTEFWKPIILVRRHLGFKEVLAFYRLGFVCVVSSLHDGMNLVAKEFVSSRTGGDGVLVLSRFTGVSRELTDAVLFNPFDREEFSEALFTALAMPEEERRKRMERMRGHIRQQNIFRWAGKIISELLKFEFKEEEGEE
ncbi:MAG: trehalose-6-phosphate synthase [bacterium]|nr:trehalose-6-phosphate synthase [bacterium]